MIWTKSIAGLRAWYYDFSRKSIETYYMYTFVFHTFAMISNTLMFSLQSQHYGDWILPNILTTVIIGTICIYILHKFTLFKDKDQHLHQQLWCGDVVDSSDEEEKNANAKTGQEIYYKCTQESDACIIYFHNPNSNRNNKWTSSKKSLKKTSS